LWLRNNKWRWWM